jgi:hypothetical protein
VALSACENSAFLWLVKRTKQTMSSPSKHASFHFFVQKNSNAFQLDCETCHDEDNTSYTI